jgi:hypothetical protein
MRLRRSARGFLIPARLERIVCKAMAEDPAARYASCGALADDLARFLRREPASVDRDQRLAWIPLWLGRRLGPAGLALSIAASLFGLGSYAWAQLEAHRIREQMAMAARELQRSRAELQRVQSELREAQAQRARDRSGARRD